MRPIFGNILGGGGVISSQTNAYTCMFNPLPSSLNEDAGRLLETMHGDGGGGGRLPDTPSRSAH